MNFELGILHSLPEGSSDAFDVPVRLIGRISGVVEVCHDLVICEEVV